MTKLEKELLQRVADLEREVRDLKARPTHEQHHHYYWPPAPPAPVYLLAPVPMFPAVPIYPTITYWGN